MNPMHQLIVFLLIACLSSVTVAEIPDYIDGPAEVNCAAALTSNPKITEKKSELSAAPLSREAAAELLLMFIFDHPMLQEAASRSSSRDYDVRLLFHASAGFTLPPLTNYGWSDRTGYYDLFNAPKLLRKLRSSKDPQDLEVRRQRLAEVIDPVSYSRWPKEQRQKLVEKIIGEMVVIFERFGEAAAAAGSGFNPIINYTSRLRDTGFLKIELRDFRGLHQHEISFLSQIGTSHLGRLRFFPKIPSSGEKDYQESDESLRLVRDWLIEYLPEVVQVREQILAEARGDVGRNRQVLSHSFPLKIYLRDCILNWYKGNFVRANRLIPVTPAKLESPIKQYLPTLVKPNLDDTIEDLTQKAITSLPDLPLDRLREVSKVMDLILENIPTPAHTQRLQDWMKNPEQMNVWTLDLIDHLGELIGQSSLSLKRLEWSLEKIKTLMPLIPSEDPVRPHEIEEARLLRLSLIQGSAVLEIRLEREIQWQQSLQQFLMLARQSVRQRALGENDVDSARLLMESLKQELTRPETPEGPIDIGGGSIIGPPTDRKKGGGKMSIVL